MKIKVISPLPQVYLPVSACLLGLNTKYSGSNNFSASLFCLIEKGYFIPIPFCPEQLGGLCTPREKSEICGKQVVSESGKNVTLQFNVGAEESLKLLHLYTDVKSIVLKDGSPSCGVGTIYDGSFSSKRVAGNGITTQLFIDNGYHCINSDIFSRPLKSGYYLGMAEEYSTEPFDSVDVKNKGCFYCG